MILVYIVKVILKIYIVSAEDSYALSFIRKVIKKIIINTTEIPFSFPVFKRELGFWGFGVLGGRGPRSNRS